MSSLWLMTKRENYKPLKKLGGFFYLHPMKANLLSLMTVFLILVIACSEKNPETEMAIQQISVDSQQDSSPKLQNKRQNNGFIIYSVDPETESIQLFWKDKNSDAYKSFENLNKEMASKNKNLKFAMNAGIFMDDELNTPLGLFVENGKVLRKINRKTGYGNFYLAPNGVFHIDHQNKAGITSTTDFKNPENYAFATQSGPMLLINGKINPQFGENSPNKYVRNGVGITDEGKVVLVISETPVTFHEFAAQFKDLGCKNALYMDGAISNYYPASEIPLVSEFGPMLGVMTK